MLIEMTNQQLSTIMRLIGIACISDHHDRNDGYQDSYCNISVLNIFQYQQYDTIPKSRINRL
jgi:hypothetical protein